MKAKRIAAATVLAVGLWGVAGPAADAQATEIGNLVITQAWIRATPKGAPTASAYLTIANRGATADRLLGGSAAGVKAVAPHSMSMDGGVMRMRVLTQGLEVPAGRTVVLRPGGDHLMLEGLTRAFRPGESVPMGLKFLRAGEVKVAFRVFESGPSSDGDMARMKMP
jgi:copper(I)-binding protein